MNKNLHNIDDLFRSSIGYHVEEVPPDVWNNIDHSLDKKQAAVYKRKYFAVRAAAIFLVLVGGVTIAAILHFNQREKISSGDLANQNTVTTSNERKHNGAGENTTQKEIAKDLIIERKKNEEQKTVVNSDQDSKQNNEENNTTAEHKKGNSKKYGTISDDYTAGGSREVPAGTNGNKSAKTRTTAKYKPAPKSPVDLVVNKQNNSLGKTGQQRNSSVAQTETTEDIQRTTHVDEILPGAGKIDLTASFATNSLNGSPIFLPTVSSNPKIIRLRNHYNSWSISPMYAQNINLNTLKDDDNFRDPRNNSGEAKRTEQETTSFSIGLGVQRQISRNIILQSAIQYFSSETSIEPKTIFAKPDARGDVRFQFYCSSGESYLTTKSGITPTVGDSIKTNFSKSEISYLQVPLLVSYQINVGKFSLLPSAGIQTNFLLNGKLNSFLEHQAGEEEVFGSIEGLRSAYLSGVIQPALNYKLSDRISFDFNPNINFSLSPINKETAIKTYRNMFSAGAGIRIKL